MITNEFVSKSDSLLKRVLFRSLVPLVFPLPLGRTSSTAVGREGRGRDPRRVCSSIFQSRAAFFFFLFRCVSSQRFVVVAFISSEQSSCDLSTLACVCAMKASDFLSFCLTFFFFCLFFFIKCLEGQLGALILI